MRLYTSLSRYKYLDKSYSLKYLFIGFLGIHVPLIGIVLFILLMGRNNYSPSVIIECTLVFTLIACALTLWIQHALTKPIVTTKNALTDYLQHKILPNLPMHFKDEAGVLMHNTSIALHELDGLIKEKRDFIYLLSHDLKTPLHNVLTLTHLMQDDHDNESKEEYLQLIRQSTYNQLQLITNVLNLASSDFTEMASMKSIYLDEVIGNIVGNLSVNLQNKQIAVQINIPSSMQITVNEERFSMAVTNLLTNAIKFSKNDGKINIDAVIKEGYTFIIFTDYGIGFNPKSRPTFEPFTKASRPGTAGESSNGLGLYFTKKIITYHGGTIAAESEGEGKGATFTIKFPFVAER